MHPVIPIIAWSVIGSFMAYSIISYMWPERQASKIKRLQMDLTPDAHDKLAALKERAGLTTYAEVVRQALGHYEWYLDQEAKGSRIVVELEDGKLERQGFAK